MPKIGIRFLIAVVLFSTFIFSTVQSAGLPGEYIVNQRWRDLFFIHSPIGNPAWLTEENYVSIRGAFAPTMGGEYKLWELGTTVPLGLYQAAGVTWLGEDDGKVQPSTTEPSGRVVFDGEPIPHNSSFVVLSYAINPWRRLSVGANLTFAYQSNFGDPLMGVGLDLGASYRVLRHPALGDHVVGISTQNLIAPSMDKTIVPSLGNSGEYSRNLKISWYGKFWESRLESGIDLDIKDFMAAADEFKKVDPTTGNITDVTIPEWGLSLKLGGWILRMINAYYLMGFDQDVVEYWGLGLGANLPNVNMGRDFSVLYQFAMKTEQPAEAQTHTIYLRVDMGKHREEIYARKMSKLLNMSPNELYNKALALFYKKKYWDAFFVFNQIDVQYPDFFKIDYVGYYMGRSLEALDMRAAAVARYQGLKSRFGSSPVIPQADLGLMRIYYRNGSLSDVSNQFVELSRPTVNDSLKYHGFYLMGEALMQNDRWSEARRLLEQLPETHPDYTYARHTAGVAAWIMGDTDNTLINLEASAKGTAYDAAAREAVNRSYLFLGYIFYERDEMSKAVTALRLIPKESQYHQEALLGLGWSAVKARRSADCIAAGGELRAGAALPILKAEGAIIETYGNMVDKNYTAALAALDAVSGAVTSLKTPNTDTLLTEQEKCKVNRAMYDFFSEDVTKQARMGTSAGAMAVLDSMHLKQEDMKGKLDAFLDFKDDFNRLVFFSRTNESVKNDIEYLYAFVRKRAASSDQIKSGQESVDKQKKIDSEIEKLKNEMNNIDTKDGKK